MSGEFLKDGCAGGLTGTPIESKIMDFFTFEMTFDNVEERCELTEYDGFGEWFLFP